jgi:peptide/nickel transport system substrate-binding protein
MPKHTLSRRTFVAGSIAAGTGIAATTRIGSAGPILSGAERMARLQDGDVAYAKAVETAPSSFTESPMLKALVDAGSLPPVAERLPKNPLVVQPVEIGQYGGLARVGNITTNIGGYDLDYITERRAYFLRYTPDLAGTELSIASKVDVSDDQSTYTITLRDGIKHSDGEPVTTADIMFWYEDILLNEDLTPVISRDLQPGGEVVKVTAIDDLTVEFKFAVPNPRFPLSHLAHQTGGWYKAEHIHPSHYLKQFHPKHNPDAEKLAKDGGWNTWMEMFGDKADRNINPERPSLSAFVCKKDSGTIVTWERNPYYWAVDTEGNQLPYIDTVEMERLQDVESYHAKIVSGAYDYAVGNTDILNFSTYEGSAEQGDYRTMVWSSGRGSEVFFQFNMNYGSEAMQKVHQDPRYRQALSLAINRQEVNDLLFFGAAVVRQMTVLPTSVNFKEEYANAWIDYDVDQANALLDEVGLTWNDDQTVRVMEDGQPLQYTFDYFDGEGPKTQILELIAEYWRAVGVDMQFKSITRQLLLPRVQTNEEPMSMWHGDASTDVLLPIDPKWSVGKYGDESSIAPLWTQWFNTQGEEGEEPPEFYLSALNTWQEYRDTLDPDKATELLQAQADNLWSIGTVGLTPWPFIVRNRLHNAPETGIHTWDGLFQYPYHAHTLFIRE